MKKNTMNTYTNSPQNRILSALLAIIMLMSVMLLSVFTADDHSAKGAVSDTTMPPYSNAADGDVAEVTVGNSTMTYGDITNAFDAAKYATESVTVKLLDDIDSFATGFSRAYGVQFQGGDITLDLNGHYLERYNNAAGTIANNRAVFM